MKKIAMGFLLVYGLIEISGIWMVFAGPDAHAPVFYLDWLNRNILAIPSFILILILTYGKTELINPADKT